jgi:hypothetical protein
LNCDGESALLTAMKTSLSLLGRPAAIFAAVLLLLNLPQALLAQSLTGKTAAAAQLALGTPSVNEDGEASSIAEALGEAFGEAENADALLAKVQELCAESPGKADAIAAAATAFVTTPEFAARVAAVAAKAAPGSAAAIAASVSRAVPSASTAIAAAILQAVPGADGAAVAAAAAEGAASAGAGDGGGGSGGGGAGAMPGASGGGGGGGSGTQVPTPPPVYGS